DQPWITRPQLHPGAALRLICLPYAGGGASVFRTWPAALPPQIEVWAIELPGRETRAREAPLASRRVLVQQLTEALMPRLHAPFAIYGHSMGSLLAFDLTRELRRRGGPRPEHLFMSGRRAPQLPEVVPMHDLPEPQLIERLRQLGGISDAVLAERELMDYFLPLLRADLSIVEAEPYTAAPPLDVPITALGGREDTRVPEADLTPWGEQTTGRFEHEMFDGGHFFLQQVGKPALLASLSRRLSRITAAL
ncbi:MAG TPA: alpha/beta fold hydrolase, partial [Kofleriaceae bacterium]